MTKRIRDYGIKIGTLETGGLNKITDVPGVTVGHYTLDTEKFKTGVTIVLPHKKNTFIHKCEAAAYVLNGFGKTSGLVQVEELGQLESPIVLTNTLNVGKVQDGVIQYLLEQDDGDCQITSINTVVAECNDSFLNCISKRPLDNQHVKEAFNNACIDFQEGDVGGGKGMSCHQLKGGIGSASRRVRLDDKAYTVGVLVQSNYGLLEDLQIKGFPMGKEILLKQSVAEQEDKGSIIIVIATDIPMDSRQLKRLCKRGANGLARVGSYMGHGSGEIVLAFSTANRAVADKDILSYERIREEKLNIPFRAVVEATEEAILNSMVTANEVCGYLGNKRHSLKDYMELYKERHCD